MADDPELDELRRRKLAELQSEAQRQGQAAAERAQYEAEKQSVLRRILTPEARERLSALAMARPEVVDAVERQLIALAQSGRVRGQIDDPTLKALLARLVPPKRETRIERR
ncbi:MAG: DNA-binding protein [Methanobacteriota archaeon]